MIIWVDDIREPAGRADQIVWCRSVDEAKAAVIKHMHEIEYIDLDHDAGEYHKYGGDYIKFLDWLEAFKLDIPIYIHIHSMNPVGRQNMERICERNGWEVIK